MSYLDKFKKNIQSVQNNENMPTVVTDGDSTQIQYTKHYKETEGEHKLVFYYRICKESQALFNGMNKTYVDITYDKEIDVEKNRTKIIPQEIVANVCGYNTYKDLYDNIENLPPMQQVQIAKMLQALVPISKEEYLSI